MATTRTVVVANLVLLSASPVMAFTVGFILAPPEYLGFFHEETKPARVVRALVELDRGLFPLVCLADALLVLVRRSFRMAVGCGVLLLVAQHLTPGVYDWAYSAANGEICW